MGYKTPESVLVIIHTKDLEVLLIERADRLGYWQSVTGSKDAGDDTFLDTAAREVAEETGIVVLGEKPEISLPGNPGWEYHLNDWKLANIYEIYPEWRHRYAPGVTHNTEHVFSLLTPREVKVTLSPREHLRYVWLPRLEAADKCFSASNAVAIMQLPSRI